MSIKLEEAKLSKVVTFRVTVLRADVAIFLREAVITVSILLISNSLNRLLCLSGHVVNGKNGEISALSFSVEK